MDVVAIIVKDAFEVLRNRNIGVSQVLFIELVEIEIY